jgi:hypothetical protein
VDESALNSRVYPALVCAAGAAVSKVYRICTEDLNRAEVLRLAGATFDSFTLQPTTGYFRGEPEDSIVLEIVQAEEKNVEELATNIRRLNGQKSVLVMSLSGEARRIES